MNFKPRHGRGNHTRHPCCLVRQTWTSTLFLSRRASRNNENVWSVYVGEKGRGRIALYVAREHVKRAQAWQSHARMSPRRRPMTKRVHPALYTAVRSVKKPAYWRAHHFVYRNVRNATHKRFVIYSNAALLGTDWRAQVSGDTKDTRKCGFCPSHRVWRERKWKSCPCPTARGFARMTTVFDFAVSAKKILLPPTCLSNHVEPTLRNLNVDAL